MPATHRSRADGTEVEAIQFDGSNHDAVRAVVGQDCFDTEHDDGRDPEVVAHVFYRLYNMWQGVKVGEWVVLLGPDEATRFDPGVFDDRYEPLVDEPPAAV